MVKVMAQRAPEVSDAELYEHDLPVWCDRQAERLRRLARDAVGDDQPDWPNLIEEIEAVGRTERHRVESLLIQAMLHLLKIRSKPTGRDAVHWAVEVRAFLDEALAAYSPSIRQSLDVIVLYRRALFQLTGRRMSADCPLTLDDLLAPFPDVAALAAKLPHGV